MEQDANDKSLKLFLIIDEEVPGTMVGDPDRIQQVLLNLLRNAIKFTERGSVSMTITLSSFEKDAFRVCFAVEDTGCGIEEHERERIFLPFTRGENGSVQKYDGIGMGLAIVKRLLQKMGSELELKSEEGKGSIFSFSLLLPSTSSAEADHHSDLCLLDKNFALHYPARILAVEDNSINMRLITRLLERLGYQEILMAASGEEALAFISRKKIDLAFMDLQMHGMDGLQLTRRIREMEQIAPPTRPMAIVALTANSNPAVRNECFTAGMNQYISKPFNTRSIAEAIDLVLSRS